MSQRVCVLAAALTLLVLALVVPPGRACPRTCNCYQASEVHCTFRSLLAIPPGLPTHTLRINLGFNSISRIPDGSLAGLQKVELLMLHGNDLHQIPDGAFRDMKSLQILKLSYNKLKEISSSLTFSGLTSLLRLHLDHNLLQHIHPKALLQLPSLRLLRLQGNRLHQLHPHSLCTLSLLNTYYYSTLRHLDLSNNSLTTLPRETLGTAPLLETLVLQSNPWSCDCRMNWFLSWSLAHPGLMKCSRGPQCPVCSSPISLQGQGLLQQGDLSCSSPIISSPGRDPPVETDFIEIQPIQSFREPLGTASLGLSDQQGHNVDLSCNITRPTNSPDVSSHPDLSLSSSSPLPLALSLSLDCPVERGSYETLWRILAYYSETAVHLEREIMLSKAPALAYRYRQTAETEGYYHTGVRASVKAQPHWLLQPAISIQLNRAQSSGNRVHLLLSTRVSTHPDPISHTLLPSSSSSSSRTSQPWVLIATNHTITSLAAVAGSRVELSCPVLSSGNPMVQWILPDGSKLISRSSSPDGRLQSSASSLLLQKLELSDAGLYHCVARAGRDVDVLALRLAVEESSVPPPGEQVGPSVTGMAGEPVSLPCNASGSPAPDINWVLPNGNVIQRGLALSGGLTVQSNGSLSLPHPSMNDVGQYRCMAISQYGTDSLSMQLHLNLDPRHAPPLRASFPKGPQSAAGRSTRIRAPLLRQSMLEEGSGGDEEEERIPSGNKRRLRPPQLPLNRRYPIGHPRRRGPVRMSPPRRGGGSLSPTEQRRNRFDNRHRISKTKQKIDPQKWADLLAKIRQRTATNNTSQPVTEPTAEPGREKDRETGGDEEESDRGERGEGKSDVGRDGAEGESAGEKSNVEVETEGSSIDDSSLQEEGLHPVHPIQTETQTYREITTGTQTGTEIETGTERSAETQPDTARENEAEKEDETGPEAETLMNRERQKEPVTSKPVSRTNEIIPQPAGGEQGANPNPSRTRSQNQPGVLPNLVPNSRPQSPWNTRRRIGQRRRINRPRGRPLTPPRPLPDPINPKLQTVTPHTTTTQTDASPPTPAATSPATTLAESSHIRTSSTLSPPSHSVSDSLPVSPSESAPPSIFSSYSLNPSLSTTPSHLPLSSSQTHTDTMTHSVNIPDSVESATHSPHIVIAETHMPATPTHPRTHTHGTQTDSEGPTSSGKHVDRPLSKHREEMERNLPGGSHVSQTFTSRHSSTVPRTTTTAITTAKITTTPSTAASTIISTHSTSTASTTPTSTVTARQVMIPITSTTTAIAPTTTTQRVNPITSTTITSSSTTTPSTSTIRSTTTIRTPPSTTTTIIIPTSSTTRTVPTATDTTTTAIPTTTHTITTTAAIPTTTTTTSTSPTTTRAATSIIYTRASTTPMAKSTSTRASSKERPSLGEADPRGRPVSGVPSQSKPLPDWRNPGANSIPDSHSSRPRQPPAPSLPASPGDSAGRPDQTNPLAPPQVPVVRSRPRIADPHIRTVSVPAESTARLACETQGEPKPSVTWTKVSTGAVMSVHSRSQRFEVLPNGTFVIQNVQLQDRGTYICSAHSYLGRDRMLTTLEVWSRPPRMKLANYREATIHQGGEVRLDCQADGIPAPLLSWVLPDRSVVTSTSPSHSRITMQANGTLYISVTIPSDRGVYRCVASNSAGAASASVRVHVSSLPPVIQQPREERLVLTAGMPVYAHCSARGAPPPTLRWRIPDGTLVRPSQFLHGNLFVLPNGTLHIRKLGPKDSGSYECTASNAVGAEKRTVRVDVKDGSERLGKDESRGGGAGSGGVGGTGIRSRQSSPSSSIHENRTSSLPVPPSNPFNSTRLSPPSPVDRSRTSHGSSGSSRSSLHPDPPNPTNSPLKHNKPVTTSPTVSSNSNKPKVSPLSPPSSLSPSVPTNNTKVSPPIINNGNVSPVDKSRSAPLSPSLPVSTLSKARIVSTSPSITTVHYGGFLQLHCSVTGNPPPTIIWRTPNKKLVDMHFSFDRRLKVHPNGSLSMQAVTEKDAGDYLCIARNKVSDDYRHLRVSVATKPAKIEPKQPSNHMVSLGGSLKVDCLASGLPDPAVRWSLPDGTTVNSVLQGEDRGGRARRLTVFDNGTLLVPAVGIGEEGEYTCYAENQGGQDSMKVKVKVMMTSPPAFTDNPAYSIIKVRQGASVSIRCRAAGDPAPTVTWRSPSNRVIPRSWGSGYFIERIVMVSDGTLEVRQAQRGDAGNYTCRASSSGGETSRVVGLEVEVPNHRLSSWLGGSGNTVGVNGRGRGASNGHSSGHSGGISGGSNTRPNGASPHYGFTNGGINRFGSSSNTNSNSRVRNTVLSTDINLPNSGLKPASRADSSIGVNGPTSGVTTRLGSSVVSVGVSGTSNVAIKTDNIGINRNIPAITSNTGNSQTQTVGVRVVSGSGLAGTSNNEVTSNDTNNSVVNSRTSGTSSNTGLISSSVSSNGPGSSILRGNEFSRSSNTGVTGSGTVVNSRNNGRTSNSDKSVNNSTNTVMSKVTSVKQQVVKGQTVLLPCPSHGSPPPRLAWLLPGNGILPAPYYGSRLTVHRNGSLELRGVRASDAGILICVVRGEREETRIQVELAVSETREEAKAPYRGPAPENPVSSEAARSGASRDSARRLSPSAASPERLPPRIPGTEKPSQRGAFLPAGPRPAGPVPEPAVSSRTAPLVSIINGETLRLPCPGSQIPGQAQGSLSWTLPSGKVLSRGESGDRFSVLGDGTLTVQRASVFDRGSYSCRATAYDSSSVSVLTVPVIVIAYPPRITTGPSPVTYTRPGVAVELPCLTIATPRATITWETPDLSQLRVTGQPRIYGNRYLSAQGSLLIQNPTSRDTGFYRCTAKNVIGADTKATYLHVM